MNTEKKRQPIAVKEIIEGFLKQAKQEKESQQEAILRNWGKIVPKQAQSCTRPVAIKNKALIIVVSNSAWLHQLSMSKEKIIKKIERFTEKGAIKNIRLKIGK